MFLRPEELKAESNLQLPLERNNSNLVHDNKFPKTNRLLSKNDFQNLRAESHFCSYGCLMAFYKKNNLSANTRVGFAVSKKVGNAVIRNKIKRIFRETFRQSNLKNNSKDVLVTFNMRRLKSGKNLNINNLNDDFEKLLLKINYGDKNG